MIRLVSLVLLVAATAWAQTQGPPPTAPVLTDLSTPAATANFVYQTKHRAVVLMGDPTPLAFDLLRDLGHRGVEVYLVCPAHLATACRALPGVEDLAITQEAPKPLWLLDGSTFLVSPYLDTRFGSARSFAMTSKAAAEMLEEFLASFFAGS